MESILQSLFSEHTDEWYEGEETKSQKKDRKDIRNSLILLGTSGGFIAGNNVGHGGKTAKGIKEKSDKIARSAQKDTLKLLGRERALDKEIRMRGGYKDLDAIKAHKEVLEKVNRRINSNQKAVEKALKVSDKMANRNLLKQTGKGTLIGAGIGLGLGALASNSIKKSNKSHNKAKRNNKKD